ncbi:LLM class flavin-dependent oxidoreductase [Tepidiforma flava]|uniref:LLM class flavin-dependent oxidoreductase n=1 Tax=Tepidiforma flava TaxID=3004094 RepID=A0ABY7M5M2_9CHLR|nr:LLM class flavin-dependent oxidoreductase [Tepidiforma flava]WBL35612.1 LLM class flavin-dependent oxidoreductase [Tepidiforma flava]
MTYRPARMRFGIFLAPFHRLGENPTVALQRDLELVDHLDRLDYDEAWFGEHHSAGWELIASPELMIAASAQRTKHIKLGTGVSSLPYHHPFMLADRMVQLDHMTRGRAMFGVGPGALTSDAYMLGIDALTQRARMDEALGVILRLFRGETVTMETEWFTMREARLQLAPYTHPHMPVAVASTFSPAGPVTAGKHGVGILSVAVSQPGGLISLAKTWEMAEEAAAKAGKTISRDDWRLVMPIHLAETREQAFADVAEGMLRWNKEYFEETLGRPADPSNPGDVESTVARGGAIIGTPDDAIEAIERLLELSGGFGCLLGLAHEWTTWEKTIHSYELWARYVAPRFQGQYERIAASQKFVSDNRTTIFGPNAAAIGKAFIDAGVQLPAEMINRMQRGNV